MFTFKDVPDFQEYHRTDRARLDPAQAAVTIMTRGQMILSRAAFELMGRPGAVVFLHDRGEHLIGFRAARRGERGASTVRRGGEHASYMVSAIALCSFLEIDTRVSRRYPLRIIDGIPCINLTEGGPSPKRRRK